MAKKNNLVNIDGGVTIDTLINTIIFVPNNSRMGEVPSHRLRGVAQQMSDGSFEFVPSPKRSRYTTKLIKKLPHGRLSRSKSGAIFLTMCFDPQEESMTAICRAFAKEAKEVDNALKSESAV